MGKNTVILSEEIDWNRASARENINKLKIERIPYTRLTQNRSYTCITLHSRLNITIALYTRLNQDSLVPKPLM
jgi:hypothetical protein